MSDPYAKVNTKERTQMGYLNFIDETNGDLVIRDVSELSFADTIETLLALNSLGSKMKYLCAVCLKEKETFEQVCVCQ